MPHLTKPQISNKVGLQHLHEIRLCLESSNASEEVFKAASILEEFFMDKILEEADLFRNDERMCGIFSKNRNKSQINSQDRSILVRFFH